MPRLPAQGADGTSDARVLGTGAADVQVPRRWPTDDARPQPPARTDTHLASLSQLRGAWGTDRARLLAERLRGAFAMFDTDGDGRLSRDELIRVFLRPGVYAFRPEEVEGAVDKIIADFDTDRDGGLQFEEFVAWWTSGPPATSAAPEGSGVAEAVVESTPHSPPPIEAAAEMLIRMVHRALLRGGMFMRPAVKSDYLIQELDSCAADLCTPASNLETRLALGPAFLF